MLEAYLIVRWQSTWQGCRISRSIYIIEAFRSAEELCDRVGDQELRSLNPGMGISIEQREPYSFRRLIDASMWHHSIDIVFSCLLIYCLFCRIRTVLNKTFNLILLRKEDLSRMSDKFMEARVIGSTLGTVFQTASDFAQIAHTFGVVPGFALALFWAKNTTLGKIG